MLRARRASGGEIVDGFDLLGTRTALVSLACILAAGRHLKLPPRGDGAGCQPVEGQRSDQGSRRRSRYHAVRAAPPGRPPAPGIGARQHRPCREDPESAEVLLHGQPKPRRPTEIWRGKPGVSLRSRPTCHARRPLADCRSSTARLRGIRSRCPAQLRWRSPKET